MARRFRVHDNPTEPYSRKQNIMIACLGEIRASLLYMHLASPKTLNGLNGVEEWAVRGRTASLDNHSI